jgi:superfamily II DNA or RNA helicase
MSDDYTPRKEQMEAIEYFNTQFETGHLHGILQAAPGFGKTTVSIKIVSDLNVNTLIVVPNEVLASQWRDAILEFTEFNSDDIGIIQGSDLKLNKPEVEKAISIVKIQSLFSQVKHNNLKELIDFYINKDFIVYDEVHTSGSATSYAKTSSLFLTPFVLGLTATPYRKGLNSYLLETSIGDVIYKAEHQNLIPDVEIHKIYVPFNDKEKNKIASIKHDYNMSIGVFNSIMKEKEEYFDYIADVVHWNFINKHNVVILLPTIKLMEKLQDKLITRHPEVAEFQLLLKGKTKEDMQQMVKDKRKILMAEYKKYKEELDKEVKAKNIKRKDANQKIKERRQEIDKEVEYLKENAIDLYNQNIQKAKIIISNPQLLAAGFDKPELSNLLIVGAPRIGKVFVIQSAGRITRIYENKPKPLVQFFIPSPFYEINKSVNVIITNNIRLQYPEAKIKYIGM